MDYVLDTNILIDLRDNLPGTRARVAALSGEIAMSIMTRIELENGVHRDPADVPRRRALLEAILRTVAVMEFDRSAVETYGSIVAAVGYSRRKVVDRMIAAQVLTSGATLVTRNPRDFTDIPGLKLEIW